MTSLRNNLNLIGRFTHEPELKKTNSDIPVLNFSIAVDRPGTNKDNRIPDFIDCVAWRGTAENIVKYFHKGDPIGIHGMIQTGTFKDKDGNDRKKTEVLVDSFEFMPSRKQGDSQPTEPDGQIASQPVPQPVQVDPDSLPF